MKAQTRRQFLENSILTAEVAAALPKGIVLAASSQTGEQSPRKEARVEQFNRTSPQANLSGKGSVMMQMLRVAFGRRQTACLAAAMSCTGWAVHAAQPMSPPLTAGGDNSASSRPAAKGADRVTIFSDDFESKFPDGWVRRGVVPTDASWFTGSPKRGAHAVRLRGSLATGDEDFDGYMDRAISTACYHNILVSFDLGATGLKLPTESVITLWEDAGPASPNASLHFLKIIKGGEPENDGHLRHYSFSLSAKADNNPNFALQFLLRGLSSVRQCGYLDNIVVTGESIQAPGAGRVASLTASFGGTRTNSRILSSNG